MEAAGQPLVTPDLAATARGLAVDAVSAEVLDALRAAHVPTILLKGPSVAEWLYHQGPGRSYLDTDVLVAPPALADAERVLAELGFQQCAVVGERGAVPTHA